MSCISIFTRSFFLVAIAAAALSIAFPLSAQEPQAKVDFQRDVAPLLRDACYACHGPDIQEAGLRLDLRKSAVSGGDSGRAFESGKSGESLLIEFVTSDDEERRMPLGEEPLSAEQIDLLRRWIDEGANWPDDAAGAQQSASDHWSFQPIRRPALPAVKNSTWPRNAIDLFLLAQMERENLSPAGEADRYTLIRRLYLDLVGLLPTPEEADAFAADPRPDAYERLVERLLASPHYGERWARRWLDLARYADTNGYEKDRVRSMWPYRDWVIESLNRDQPFDRFTIEQIAGDMLPDATLAQRIATGFHRNTMINEEGGIDVEEFRFHSVVDRVGVTGTVWLGLTIACAQCHSHKYDPISQREFYQMFALLNNADELELSVPNAETARKRAAIDEQIASIQSAMRDQLPNLVQSGAFAKWEAEITAKASNWTVARPTSAISRNNATTTILDDGSVLVSGDIPNLDVYDVELKSNLPRITALRLEALPHDSLPNGGPGRAVFDSGAGAKGDFLLSEVTLSASEGSGGMLQTVSFSEASHSHTLAKRSAALAIDGVLDTGWSIGDRTGEPHHIVLQLAEPLDVSADTQLKLTLDQHYIHQMTLGRFRVSLTADELPVESCGAPADVEQILVTPLGERTDEQQRRLEEYYLTVAPELAEQQKQIAELRKQMPEHPTTLIMQERADEHERTTMIHHRGEFLKPREEVAPGVPDVLHELPDESDSNRLTLARWLVDKENPLTARVVMNRHWQSLFGRGLVQTSEDFGSQGAPPTHPELLDWLAAEFTSSGWSLKQMHRLMVSSAAYRQSSHAAPELRERDPENRWLSRGPRVRVEAEIVRDLALDAAGLLSEKLGGPSVFPPQSDEVTSLSYGKLDWATSTGADRYRRGLYTFAKRTTPYAAFSLFDAPSGETCIVRRQRSNTPLQALTLLNDVVFVEAAQSLAQGAIQSADSSEGRAAWIFRRCLTRPPDEAELAMLIEYYDTQRGKLQADNTAAEKIAGIESSDDSVSSDTVELAAWTALARAVLNLDETITKE